MGAVEFAPAWITGGSQAAGAIDLGPDSDGRATARKSGGRADEYVGRPQVPRNRPRRVERRVVGPIRTVGLSWRYVASRAARTNCAGSKGLIYFY